MCLNIALEDGIFINNLGQKMAGTGTFVSKLKGAARYDDPARLRLCRLHFEGWHENRNESNLESMIPFGYFELSVPPFSMFTGAGTEVDDMDRFRKAMFEDTSIAKGFWQLSTKRYCLWNQFTGEEDREFILRMCSRNAWALIPAPIGKRYYKDYDISTDEPVTIGGWWKDGHGCYLGYMIPVGHPIRLIGGFEKGPSGFIYQVGEMGIEVPHGTEWGVFVRCSDSGYHSGFTIVRLEWYESSVRCFPVLVSLYPAPHDFPASCTLPEVENSLEGAVMLAEWIAQNGGFPDDEGSPKNSYDAHVGADALSVSW